MNVKERVAAPTPRFFRKIRMTGLVLAAISGALLTAAVSLPATIVTLAGYAGVAGGIMSAISQMTVEESSLSKEAHEVKNKARKRKGIL